jgi:hypothetical protein
MMGDLGTLFGLDGLSNELSYILGTGAWANEEHFDMEPLASGTPVANSPDSSITDRESRLVDEINGSLGTQFEPDVRVEDVNGEQQRVLSLGNVHFRDNGSYNRDNDDDRDTFITRAMRDFSTMTTTPSGQRLINDLTAEGRGPVNIAYLDRASESRGNGSGSPTGGTVQYRFEPGLNTSDGSQADFGTAEGMPSDVRLFHELVHVDDGLRGISSQRNLPTYGGADLSEMRAVGLGPFARFNTDANSYTENSYRADRDLPERTFYGDPATFADGADHRIASMPAATSYQTARYLWALEHPEASNDEIAGFREGFKPAPANWDAENDAWHPEGK